MSRIGLVSLLIVDNDNLRLVKKILNKNTIRVIGNYLANKTQKCLASFSKICYWDRNIHMRIERYSIENDQFASKLIVTYNETYISVHIMRNVDFTVYVNRKYAYGSNDRFILDVFDQTHISKVFTDPFEAINYMIQLE